MIAGIETEQSGRGGPSVTTRAAILAGLVLALAAGRADAQAPAIPPAPAAPAVAAAPAAGADAAGVPSSVYVVSAVVNMIPLAPVNRRVTRVCNVTGVVRQFCGASGTCEINSRSGIPVQAFFMQRHNEIAQSCDTRLSTITDVKVAYRCRYGDRIDGNIIEESRSIALEDNGEPLGRSGFRIIMACH